jgi:DNA-binding LytR/AlgR family response regulator
MKKYKCIIIDDEPYAIERLEKYVENIPYLMLMKSYTNPLQAIAELMAGEQIDLALLDIHMPLISGIDLSRKIRPKVDKLIFTTAHSEYGYDAFEVDADAYLLKPYTLSKFAATIGKIFPDGKVNQTVVKDDGYFFAKNNEDGYKMVKIMYKDIVAVESKQNYVVIHRLGQNIRTHMSLTEMNKVLEPYPSFAQLQRSFIVGLDHIAFIYGNTVKMTTGLEITVGEYYRKNLTEFLSGKIIKGRTA